MKGASISDTVQGDEVITQIVKTIQGRNGNNAESGKTMTMCTKLYVCKNDKLATL